MGLTRSAAASGRHGRFCTASVFQSCPPRHRTCFPRHSTSTSAGVSGGGGSGGGSGDTRPGSSGDTRPGSSLPGPGSCNTGPEPWPSSRRPTPYDIFGHARDVPYDKTRFLHLVKQYHPDRHRHSAHDGIPYTAKLERYRLVVAANHILSHPGRRRLYDQHGLGWAEHVGDREDPNAQCRAADRAWRAAPGSAQTNATWEDWERWRQQRDGTWQEPAVYTSNGAFATIAVVLAVMATWGHVAYSTTSGNSPMSLHEERHAAISAEMRRRQSELQGTSRDARVESFVRQRQHDLMAAHMRQADQSQPPEPAKAKVAGD